MSPKKGFIDLPCLNLSGIQVSARKLVAVVHDDGLGQYSLSPETLEVVDDRAIGQAHPQFKDEAFARVLVNQLLKGLPPQPDEM